MTEGWEKFLKLLFLNHSQSNSYFNAIFAQVCCLYLSNSSTKTVQFLSLEIIHTMLIATSIINYL